jgi:hypothetical protein
MLQTTSRFLKARIRCGFPAAWCGLQFSRFCPQGLVRSEPSNREEPKLDATQEQVQLANRAADQAIELWQKSEREQAVAMLQESFKQNPAAGADYSWLLGTWQLLLGHPADQVLELLHKHASFVPE